MDVEGRLQEAGITLPDPPRPRGNYEPFVLTGNLLFISGQLPLVDGKLGYEGAVGDGVSAEEGYDAARLCALNVLAQIKAAVGSFDRLRKIVRIEGRVRCTEGWKDIAGVVNGASDLFADVLGDAAGHARAVTGHRELSLGTPVEIVVIAEVENL